LRLPFNEIAMANMAPKNIGTPRNGTLCRAALVVEVTVTVNGMGFAAEFVPVRESEAGLMEQVVFAGAPEQVSATVPLKLVGPPGLWEASVRL
jgi:hypothetical protein